MNFKRIFASDIDNTLTDANHIIPDQVVDYLTHLHHQGWHLIFLTGRTYSFAMKSMEKFKVPYILGVQNGAEVLQMPEKRLIFRRFLPREILHEMEKVFAYHSLGYIVYSGFEEGDFCYYELKKFSEDVLIYFEKLKKLSSVAWKPIESYEEIKALSFPLIKGFGDRKALSALRDQLALIDSISVSVIGDSVDKNKGLLLITAKGVTKGEVLKNICHKEKWKGPIVAAGDDENDLSLLEMADISICVSGGSPLLRQHADIIADSSVNLGIIKAMEQVIRDME